jgi:hypothetical protein
VSNSIEEELTEYNKNKIDWDELHSKSPDYIEISKSQFILIIGLILLIIIVLEGSIWGMWKDGDQ